MGDWADEHVDALLNGSYWDEYDVEPGDWDDGGGFWFRRKPQPRTCQRCGKGGLWWRQVGGSWRLHEYDDDLEGLEPHICEIAAPEFAALAAQLKDEK